MARVQTQEIACLSSWFEHSPQGQRDEAACDSPPPSPQSDPSPHISPDSSDSESLRNALDNDDNVLIPIRYAALREAFLTSLEGKKDAIEATVRFHLGVRACHLSVREVWKSGSFNVVLPILISQTRTVFMRIPFPYRIGEDQCPGNVDEKLRTEIATYIWLRRNCPDIPIPELHAFGLPDGSTVLTPLAHNSIHSLLSNMMQFTHPLHAPFWEKAQWTLQRLWCKLLGRPIPVHHVKRTTHHTITPGFLLISEAQGKKLAWSWLDHYHEKAYRDRLLHSLARISLSLNAVPLPRIGSLKLQPDGSLTLCNRPLSLYFHMLENEGIPPAIPRHRTYGHIEPYLSDLLSLQDNKIQHQPNAIHNEQDGKMQLAALTALRAIMHHFIYPECREGPFYLQLTDLHQQNIFVDQDWNIQTVIDLEWAHTLPLQMKLPPHWLSSRIAVDGFDDQAAITDYEAVLREYWAIYEAEERKRNGRVVQVPIQRDTWARRGFWYYHAVRVPKAMYTLFNRHIQPLYNGEHAERKIFDDVFYWYWGSGARGLIERKLGDRGEYMANVREAFKRQDLEDL